MLVVSVGVLLLVVVGVAPSEASSRKLSLVVTVPPSVIHGAESGPIVGPSFAGGTATFFKDGPLATGPCGLVGSAGSWRLSNAVGTTLYGTLFHPFTTSPPAGGCPGNGLFQNYYLTITGGTGRYSGATGDGVWHRAPVPSTIVGPGVTAPAPGVIDLTVST